jgi:vacuolar-type H+-ATPase subunit E/Vma4
MEKVINLIYDVEEKVNRILEQASEEKLHLNEQLQKDLEKLDSEIKSDTQNKINALQEKMNQEIETERQNLIDASKQNLINLEENFNINQETLVSQVVKNIIGE